MSTRYVRKVAPWVERKCGEQRNALLREMTDAERAEWREARAGTLLNAYLRGHNTTDATLSLAEVGEIRATALSLADREIAEAR